MKCSSGDDDDESSIALSLSDSDSVVEAPPQKRPRQLGLSPQMLLAQRFPEEEQPGMVIDVRNLSKMWRKMLTENL